MLSLTPRGVRRYEDGHLAAEKSPISCGRKCLVVHQRQYGGRPTPCQRRGERSHCLRKGGRTSYSFLQRDRPCALKPQGVAHGVRVHYGAAPALRCALGVVDVVFETSRPLGDFFKRLDEGFGEAHIESSSAGMLLWQSMAHLVASVRWPRSPDTSKRQPGVSRARYLSTALSFPI